MGLGCCWSISFDQFWTKKALGVYKRHGILEVDRCMIFLAVYFTAFNNQICVFSVVKGGNRSVDHN